MSDAIKKAFISACAGLPLSPATAKDILEYLPAKAKALVAAALAASFGNAGPKPFTCAIINAKSGRCSEDCAFCAQSRFHNTVAPVYPLLEEKAIIERASLLAEKKVTRLGLVTSGAGPSRADFDKLCAVAGKIRERFPLQLCASLGVLDDGKARSLKQAGFTSYHHNLETARSFYPHICASHSYNSRRETVLRAKAAGLRVCSGGLFGLGESWEQRLELAETLRELDVDSIPINFLMPIPGTPLQRRKPLRPLEGLAVIALFRLLHPGKDIVICGGRSTTLGDWDRLVFFGAANGVMLGDYLTTNGNPFDRDLQILRDMGEANADSDSRWPGP